MFQFLQTDKASLLAKVVQRVRELKQQTSELSGLETFPSETDEVTVLSGEYSSDGQLIFKASLCCEDRLDLMPELNEILKSLHLKTLKAEMVTLGGRIRNVLIIAADKDHSVESVHFLQNALKSLLERSNSSEKSKRRRILDRKLVIQWWLVLLFVVVNFFFSLLQFFFLFFYFIIILGVTVWLISIVCVWVCLF